MKNRLMMFAMLTTMSIAAAASAADCDSTSCVDVTIARIFAGVSGDVEYRVDGNTVGLSCTDERNAYLTLRADHPNYDTISKMAWDAHLARKRVWFRMDTSVCDISYIVIDAQ